MVSIVAAEAFPEGVLDGVVAHWGIAGVGRRGGWESPLPGWQSDPDASQEAGMLVFAYEFVRKFIRCIFVAETTES